MRPVYFVGAVELLEMLSPIVLAHRANGDWFHSHTALFRVTDWRETPVPDGTEIAEARFFALDDLLPLTRLGRKAQGWPA